MSREPEFVHLPISADNRPRTTSEQVMLWIVGVGFGALLLASLAQQYVPQKLSVFFFFLFWPVMLVVHELGHAGMARLCGWKVGRISIGFGPLLWRGTIGTTAVSVRLLPIEGFVIPAPVTASGARLKTALIYAAGPGLELLVLAGMLAAFGFDGVFSASGDVASVALKTLAIVIIWGAGFNLLPFAVGGGVSDGLGILLSPVMTRESIELRLLALDELDIAELANDGATDDAVARIDALAGKGVQVERLGDLAIALLAADGQHEAARARMDARLAQRPVVSIDDPALLHLDALCWLAAPSPDPVAVDLSLNRALRLAPDNTSLRVTRGIADIRRGDAVGGGNQLADVYRQIEEPMDRARALGWLAVAARRVGHANAAARFASAFEHVNEHSGLRRLVRTALRGTAGDATSGPSADRP